MADIYDVYGVMGAITGDIIGSVYEFNNHKSKDFPLFSEKCFPTDDSIMTIAVAKALMDCDGDYTDLEQKTVAAMREVGQPYPHCGYGGRFMNWMYSDDPQPYNSYGNGAAMRVSPVAYAARSLDEAIELSYRVTSVTHNHPEGIKGAEATVVAAWLALNGELKKNILKSMAGYYDLGFTLDEIRPTYRFDETCQNTVPQAIKCFEEADSFEDAIRNAISIGGDSDTLAAIAGAIAGAFYGVPPEIGREAAHRLDNNLRYIIRSFVEYIVGR